ncbi:hypothetical protein SAMN04488059_101296 [Devosia psychrophila]|uniref:Uncharacterized protein n=1 Tax=Devosia psychrophila TaxID=728005 RepID=A0A1I1FIR9_9HYPH|nr:hypothetical protein SAMN04488059_101296 [Devosia psychrophila]
MAETAKTPRHLNITKIRPRACDDDDYQEYMRAVLRQANKYPDKPFISRTH